MKFEPIKNPKSDDNSKNIMLFAIAVLILLFAFDAYVMQPKLQKLDQAQRTKSEANKNGVSAQTASNKTTPPSKQDILQATERIDVYNGKLDGSLNLTGARLDDLKLSEYYKTLKQKDPVDLLNPRDTKHPYYAEFGWVAKQSDIKVPGPKSQWQIANGSELTPDSPVTLVWDNGQGITFEKRILIDEDYLFTVEQKIINRTDRELTFHPFALVSRHGLPQELLGSWILHEGPIAYFDKELHQRSYKALSDDREPYKKSAGDGWIGITDKYWMVSLLPDQFQKKTYRFVHQPPKTPSDKPRYQVDMLGSQHTVGPQGTVSYTNHLFAGAKEVILLEEYEEQLGVPHFDLAVDFGWLYFITKPIFHVLHYFFTLTGNFGIAIILLTVCLRLAVFPLANTSYKSFARLKQISPQIVELRDQYKDNKQALQQELVKLYEREKVNPLAGCFPILIQIPIFFSLYKVLYITIEMRHAPFFGWIQDLSVPDPTSVFNAFGLLPYDVPGFLQIGIWPCLMLLTLLVQQRLNPPPQDPIQQQMLMFFPFVITYVMAKFAAGLVVYWTLSAMLAIVQQYIIMRRMGVEVHLFKRSKDEEKLDEMVAEGPDVHPAAEMISEDIEKTVFDGEEDQNDEKAKKISKPKPKKSKKR